MTFKKETVVKKVITKTTARTIVCNFKRVPILVQFSGFIFFNEENAREPVEANLAKAVTR